jgi:hypothetical protein
MTTEQTSNNGGQHATGKPIAKMELPAGWANLNQRYPQLNHGVDARDIKRNLGKWGHPIQGYILGEMSMPATIPDPDTGELKPWNALCIELTRPHPVTEPDPESPDRVVDRMAKVGERVIMSITSAVDSLRDRGLQRILDDLEDRQVVHEVIMQPQAGKTRDGGRALWLYPTFSVSPLPPIKREAHHVVVLSTRKADKPAVAAAKPAPSLTPFDDKGAAGQSAQQPAHAGKS